MDFGIAGLVQDDKAEKSRAGSLKYMAPEVLSGANTEAHPGLDVWSMGCLLFAMVCGELPFTGKTSGEIVEKIKKGEYQFPHNSGVSYHCRKLIRSMLTIDYIKRIGIKEILEHPWMTECVSPTRALLSPSSKCHSKGESPASRSPRDAAGKEEIKKQSSGLPPRPQPQIKPHPPIHPREESKKPAKRSFRLPKIESQPSFKTFATPRKLQTLKTETPTKREQPSRGALFRRKGTLREDKKALSGASTIRLHRPPVPAKYTANGTAVQKRPGAFRPAQTTRRLNNVATAEGKRVMLKSSSQDLSGLILLGQK